MATYPDNTGFKSTFSRCELTLNGKIYTAITNVSIDQPTERAGVKGTKPFPIGQTAGTMDLGEGTITFSDEAERMQFINDLGDGYREKLWGLTWVIRSGTETFKTECVGCAVTGNPIDHGEGADALGGDIAFSFMSHKINGKSPHLP